MRAIWATTGWWGRRRDGSLSTGAHRCTKRRSKPGARCLPRISRPGRKKAIRPGQTAMRGARIPRPTCCRWWRASGPLGPAIPPCGSRPRLAPRKRLDATAPTPAGLVAVRYRVARNRLIATIRRPANLPVRFEWRGKAIQVLTARLPAANRNKRRLPSECRKVAAPIGASIARRRHPAAVIDRRSGESPSTTPSISSPGAIGPTPAGVPV